MRANSSVDTNCQSSVGLRSGNRNANSLRSGYIWSSPHSLANLLIHLVNEPECWLWMISFPEEPARESLDLELYITSPEPPLPKLRCVMYLSNVMVNCYGRTRSPFRRTVLKQRPSCFKARSGFIVLHTVLLRGSQTLFLLMIQHCCQSWWLNGTNITCLYEGKRRPEILVLFMSVQAVWTRNNLRGKMK